MEDNKLFYTPDSVGEKMVADYTNMTIREVDDLDIDEYLYYFRDAFIHSMNQTEEGRKYLENAYFYKQTKPDRGSLRKKFGRK